MTYQARPSWIASSSGDGPAPSAGSVSAWVASAALPLRAIRYLNSSRSTAQLKPMSTPPSPMPIATETTTTTTVNRTVSSRVGQDTFFSSEMMSRTGFGTSRSYSERCFAASAAAAARGFRTGGWRRSARLISLLLPDLAVRPVDPAARAVLAQLQPLRVVAAVLRRRVRALLALRARERDDLPVFLLRHRFSAAALPCRADRTARPPF